MTWRQLNQTNYSYRHGHGHSNEKVNWLHSLRYTLSLTMFPVNMSFCWPEFKCKGTTTRLHEWDVKRVGHWYLSQSPLRASIIMTSCYSTVYVFLSSEKKIRHIYHERKVTNQHFCRWLCSGLLYIHQYFRGAYYHLSPLW